MVGDEIFNRKATGFVTKFTDGGSEKRVEFIHRVKLTGLIPGKSYGTCKQSSVVREFGILILYFTCSSKMFSLATAVAK